MSFFNIETLPVVLVFDNGNITIKFLVETTKSALLKVNKIINVDQMISECHLVLLFCFIQITIIHLNHGFFGIDLTIVVLLVDLNIFL